ncbi:ABC transporter permease [Sphingobacterium sp. lm-10]|uniref:ABC transporter permease n=1 Tax=Sphingobacterium sp. lm-10 TaxID=2944904 RepID=UPI0020220E7C|nr:ABC transporter permease [Sphingobacterium sp. lm-10]MCL7988099.1 ABC transporter permease [Sphingobacterium sp. lm-10]
MLRNYLKVTLRTLTSNKGYTFINIVGLSIGMAAAILIILWIQNELSMDRFHEKADRTYLIYNRDHYQGELFAWSSTPKILGPTLATDYQDVEAFTRRTDADFLLTVGEKKLKSSGSLVDPAFLQIFSFPLLEGNAENVLAKPEQIVLTKEFAERLFGEASVVGKTVRIDSVHQFTVSGILEDLPANTSIKFDYLLPWSYMKTLGWDDEHWGINSIQTYVLLKSGASQAAFDQKSRTIKIDHTKEAAMPSTQEVFTQPFYRDYLYGKSENGRLVAGNIVTVRMFIIIAAFILLIACINFMNLSTARSERRAKEVGIRKVAGVKRSGLIAQFLGESLFLSTISGLFAIILVSFVLPYYNGLVQEELTLPLQNIRFWLGGLGFVLFTGLLAGSYPAFYLSSFNPVKVLKGTFRAPKSSLNPRKVLVTLQFTFAITLMISTAIIAQQIRYGLDREAGYDRDQLIYVFMEGELDAKTDLIRHDLQEKEAILSLTKSLSPITQRRSDNMGFLWDGSTTDDERASFILFGSDADFVSTMGITLVAGRDIDIRKFPTDSTALLINESAAKAMRLEDPIGKTVRKKGEDSAMHIVGVVQDFIFESPFQSRIAPLMISGPANYYANVMHFRLNPIHTAAANLATIEEVLNTYNPDYPFDYYFVDQQYAKKFGSAERTYKLVLLFSALTVVISCLGLFGLATYTAESRTKEIGVRKVLGASVPDITVLLSKEFLLLILLSFLIASPIAWYTMDQWLSDYSYRIAIAWWVFAGIGLLAIAVTLATVSFQAIKAALANPVKSLRHE